MQSSCLQCQVNLMGALAFLLFFFYISFILKLIVGCRFFVIYMREENDSNALAMITRLI